MNALSAGKSVFLGTSTQLRVKETPKVARASVVVRAQQEEKVWDCPLKLVRDIWMSTSRRILKIHAM